MTDITVNRWKRFGHDHLYANGPDGNRLGKLDRATGEITVEDGADSDAVTAALNSWHEASGSIPQPAKTMPSTSASAEEPLAPKRGDLTVASDDLALRTPGQNAREHAAAAWEREKRIGTGLAVIGRLVDVHTDERAWRLGAKGEEAVAKGMQKALKQGWRVLHSIPCAGDTDIDHLLIGPGGVLLVNSKHHPKAKVTVTKYGVNVNGSKTEHFPQIRTQMKTAKKALSDRLGRSVDLLGLIAIYNGPLLTSPELKGGSNAPDVKVVTNWNISNVLLRLDPVLSEADIDEIYEVARRPSTWL